MMIDILVPLEQEGTKAIVRAWLKKVGDAVAENDPLVELETDKVTQEVSAPATGILESILLSTDAEAVPGGILGRIRAVVETAVPGELRTPDPVLPASMDMTSVNEPLALSPAVRRAIRQTGIDPATIAGTGRGGRITRGDVDQAAADRGKDAPAPVATPASTLKSASAVALDGAGNVSSVPHDRMRLAIAQNMLNSVTTAPHVTAMFEADFSAIIAHRRKHKATFERDGVNLTFTAYLIAASAAAMRTVPAINSRWYDDHLDIYDDINIGVGTALGEKGLIVPVVQRTQELSLLGIAKRLGELIGRARDNTLSSSDVRGGTFTISNHGVSGSLFASPIIINQPQSAILGVGKTEKRVVVREVDGVDSIQIRPMAYVSLTIDHRVIDGHQTNIWLTKFVETLENWPL